MTKAAQQKQATRLHTHTVIFRDGDDVEVAIRALLGQSTKAICKATGLPPHQVQYRVSKAGINRWDFRHGRTPLAQQMIEAGWQPALQQVSQKITPKFAQFATKTK